MTRLSAEIILEGLLHNFRLVHLRYGHDLYVRTPYYHRAAATALLHAELRAESKPATKLHFNVKTFAPESFLRFGSCSGRVTSYANRGDGRSCSTGSNQKHDM